MAIEAELADGRILEFPDGTDPKVIQDAVKRLIDNPLSGVTTEKLKAIPSAPSTLRDLNETAAMSLAGGIKGLSDLFGVDNTVSKYFGEKQTQALKQMTPERLRELQIEEELAKRAEGSPSEEFTTAGRAFLRSPAQGLVGGVFGSVPIIAATALAPAVTLPAAMTARLGTGIAGRIAGKAAAASPAIAVGSAMGVGSQKGQDYEAVKKAMLERGASEEEAEMAAQKAAEYSAENAARQAASGIAGGLEGAVGVESVLGRMGRGRAGVDGSMTAPTWKGAAVQSTIGEAIPEAIQAATGAVGTNVALQQAGFDRDLTAGVIGQVTNDALTGALLGTAVTPLQKMSMQAEFDRSQLERDQQKRQKEQETIDKVREQLGVDKQLLALPAPAQRIEEPPVTDVLNNPFGRIARNELPLELIQQIDDHRAKMGRPGPLPSYSIEDIQDSMPGTDPVADAGYIDYLLTAKSGYTEDITYTPKTVMDVAGQKNVATGTKGFADFLTRITGISDLNSMSQPQLHAAFTALTNLPTPEEGAPQTILPEGTNALRFDDGQFFKGYNALLMEIESSDTKEIPRQQAIEAIKAEAGIENDVDANKVLELSLKADIVEQNEAGNLIAREVPDQLPPGFAIQAGTFKQGEQQQYVINAGDRPLEGIPTFSEPQQAAEKITALEAQRQKQADVAEKRIETLQEKIQESQDNLEGMEAAGEANSQEYKVASAAHNTLTKDLNGQMLTLQTRRDKLLLPLSIEPTGMKMVTRQGFTVFENGMPKATFPTKDAAIDGIVFGMPDERLNEAAAGKLPSQRTVARKSQQELDRRQGKPVKIKEGDEKINQMAEALTQALQKFGLKDIGLKLVAGMKDEGSYAGRLIKIALDADSPIGVLRHESIHALKDLGFFTPQQWSALERMAETKWVNQYLRQRNINGDPLQPGEQSRFDAYVDIYGGNMNDVIEEAIADAFRDFDVNKAPPGMLTALLKRMKDFFEALGNALRGLGYQTAEDIFGKIEAGALKRTETQETVGEKPSLWKATPEDREMAEAYDFQNGIMPYTSEGQIQVPLDVAGTKFSIKKPYDQKKLDKDETLKNDPFTGLPLNANGTVTLYYPTTNELARDLTKTKKLKGHSPTANRIYLTNESSAGAIEAKPGDIDQPVGGANVLLQVDPSMLHVLNEYEDGRKDFFIPIAEGTAFAEKMAMTKLFTLNAPRTKGLHPDRTLSDVTKAITETADKWAKANAADRREMAKDAKTVLRQSHNIEKLFGANSKLEKTNIGDYGLTYKGKKVMSTGLGFASAQKINDMQRATTCPQSGICEDLCLGETSGQNLLYGGDGQFRSGPRLSQYLKTEALVVNPEAFAIAFIKQITAFRKAALDLDYHPAIRLNVTSDFNPKMFEAVINMFPDVTFYDYTKLDTKPIAPNHHLTYSSTGASQLVKGEIIVNKFSNWDRMVDKILAGGKNVAMAFTSRSSMPKFVKDERTGKTFEVWNGDEYDARFLDPVREDGVGLIIGLTNKDNTTKPEDAAKKHNGFFLDYDPERDGETLVIRDQTKMKEGVVKPITFTKKPEKLSLRAPDTKAFKQWFGDSKVVDEDGEPLVVYHGTTKDIDQFKISEKAHRAGNPDGFYFTIDPKEASKYSDKGEGANVLPVYLQLVNPFLEGSKVSANMIRQFEKELRDDNPNLGDDWIKGKVAIFKEYATSGRRQFPGIFPSISFPSEAMTRVLTAGGYDGFKDGKHWIVVKPTQVKSATGNIGTFDETNPDIRYSLRKVPLTQDEQKYFDVVFDNKSDLAELLELVPSARLEVSDDSMKSQLVFDAEDIDGLDEYLGDTWASSKKQYGGEGASSLPKSFSSAGNAFLKKARQAEEKLSLRTPPKSPEFQAYMAGSKMVDEDGNPQVWYHGTARNISIFRPKQATSIFLTQDPDFAASFAEDSLNWMARNATDELTAEQKAQAIDDAVAKVQKDYDFVQKDDPDFRKLTKHKNDVISDLENNSFSKRKMGEEAKDYLMQASKAYFPSAPNIMPLYVRAVKPFDFSNKEHLDMVMRKAQEYFDMSKMEFPEKFLIGKKGLISRGLWQAIEAEPVQRAIRSLGFDSYFIKEGGVKNLAVYSPAQVASATGNVGSFKQRTPTFDEALNLGMTREEAIEAQKAGDIRLSLRGKKIDKDMEASVDRVTYAREEKGWMKRFTDALHNTSLRQAFLDRYDTIYNNTKRVAASKGEAELFADVSAHSAALLSDNAAGVAAQALGLEHRAGGIPVFRNGGTFIFNDNGKIKGLLEILKPLAAYGNPRVYQYYQTWAGAKRGSRYDKLGVLTPYTPDDYKQAAKFEKEFPEFVDIQKEWDTYNRGLVKYMIDTGVIDRAKGEEWMKHGDYLPFYRQLDDQAAIGPKVFQALSGVKGPKKLKGSEDPLGDFMENMVRNTQAAIESGMKNVAAQRVVRDALFLREAKKIQGPFKADINTVSVLENGKQVNYHLADAMLAEAMKGLRMAEIPFLAIAAAPANLLRSVVTKMPDFIGANLMRDSLSAYVTSGAKITPVIDTIRNFGAAIADKSPALDILRSYGVIGGYDLAQNVEKSGKDLAKDLRKKTGTRTTKEKILSATGIVPLWGALEKGSAASDAATRMAVFEATMKETGNEVEAAFRAMEVMNFSRKGNSAVIRVLTAITPFLNARMQGLDVLYRAGIRPIWPGSTPTEKEKAIAKSFYIRGMTLASLSVMYYMLTHDDDDYKKQEQETRDNNWLIPSLGIKIPIPFEVGVIFKVLPERLTAYFLGNDTGKDLMLSAKRNITSTFGIQLPQAILPAIEVATNYSFFTGREIVGQGMQDIDKQFQINPNTTKLSQAIGNLTSFKTASGTSWGVSPIEIDHLISGYLGGLGMYMAESIDMIIDMNSDNPKASKRFEQMPVIKRFALDPKARGSVTAYYELKNAVDETVRTDNYLTRTMKMDAKGEYMQDYAGLLLTRDYVNTLEKSMKEFREMKTIIQNSPMSADDKRDALSAIIDVENDLTANIKDIRKAIQ